MITLFAGLVVSCGSDSPNEVETPPDTSTIADTVRRNFDAYNSGDVDALNDTSCSAAQRSSAAPPGLPTIVHDVGVPTVDGDLASVPVTMSVQDADGGAGSKPSTVTLYLVPEDGAWVFCMFER